MHPFRMFPLALSFFLLPIALAAQGTSQQTTSPPRPGRSIALALKSMDAQTAGAPINDVTLTGTVTLAGGPDAGSGPVTLSATADGKSQINMNLPSGQQTEIRSYSRMSHTGTWTNSEGASHDFSVTNTLGPHPAWYFPAFVMQRGFMSTQYFAGDLGPATWDGASVEHLQIFRRPSSERFRPAVVNPLLKQMSLYDIYLDPSSLLPVAMTFNVHLDSANPTQFLVPAGTPAGDYLEEVRFSDYQQVQGRPVAFHVQVYFNGVISADIQLASANFEGEAATAAQQQ
ncbi:MAG: hypothetical protein ACLQMT_02075 [Candidatus Acidiferrales bacterium]